MPGRYKLKNIANMVAVVAIVAAPVLSAMAQSMQRPGDETAIAQGALPELLERNAWTIDTYYDGSALVSSSDVFPTPGWITFSDGNLEGTPGCGGLIGHYRANDPAIVIQAGVLLTGSCISNRAGGPVNLLDDSRRVTQALSRTQAIASSGSQLILHDANGATLATLSPRE